MKKNSYHFLLLVMVMTLSLVQLVLAAPPPSSRINGTVLRQQDGTPLPNTEVRVKSIPPAPAFEVNTLTDIDGRYTFPLFPGSYKVWATGFVAIPICTQPRAFLAQYYLNAPNEESATVISLALGQEIENVDFNLAEGGVISGTVFNQLTGEPITQLFTIIATDVNSGSIYTLNDISSPLELPPVPVPPIMREFVTEGYRLTGLPTGQYIVRIEPHGPRNYDWEVYNNQAFLEDADIIDVTIGEETANINFFISHGGRFVGVVYDEMGGWPLANATVILYDHDWNYIDSDVTNCHGKYKLEAPRKGRYYLYAPGIVDGLLIYEPEYFRDETDQASANVVRIDEVGERVHREIYLHRRECMANVAGVVWDDANNNGVKDPGELGLANVQVHLCLPFIFKLYFRPIEHEGPEYMSGQPSTFPDENIFPLLGDGCAAVLTDANGNYLFKNVPLGPICLDVDVTTLPNPNLVPTNTSNPLCVEIPDCYNTYQYDFGFGTQAPPAPLPVPPPVPATLVFLNGSPSYDGEGWDNAVDGDLFDWDGTATVRGDDPNTAGPAWGIFQFSDGGTYHFNGFGVQTENGQFEERERMATKIEVLVSTTGTDVGDFTSIKMINKTKEHMQTIKLDAFVSAKYIKLILHQPNWLQGGWRHIVEFKLLVDKNPGVNPASERAGIAVLPGDFALEQNYPNPFNPQTTITYRLPEGADVSLKVFDLAGREVASLADGFTEAGLHTAVWNAAHQPSGIYLLRMQAGAFQSMKRMLLVK